MENKDFRNALLEAIKNELKDFTQVQRDLKKSRKLEFRPKDRSLQSIVDEIIDNASKIQHILFYYVWLKHGKQYWTNREIDSFWKYYCSAYNTLGGYPEDYENKNVWWANNDRVKGMYNTYSEYVSWLLKEFIEDKAEQFDIELPDNLNDFVEK